METLQHIIVQNSPTRWLLALGLTAGVVLGLILLRRLTLRFLYRHEGPSGVIRRVVVTMADHTTFLFQVIAGLGAAAQVIELPRAWDRRIDSVLAVALLLQTGYWLHHVVRVASDAIAQTGDGPNNGARKSARNILSMSLLTLLWSAIALLAMENLGINVSALVTGLGVTGVAVALATQNIVGDLFASISILLDKPFLVGDFIIMDAYMGTVDRIGVRSTRLRSLSGEEIILANGDISKSRIRNFRTMPERRVLFNFTVRYETPSRVLRTIPQMVQEAVTSTAFARFDRAELLVFADFGLTYEVVFYVAGGDYNRYTATQQTVNYNIMERFEEAGVHFAYRSVMNYSGDALQAAPPRSSRGRDAGDNGYNAGRNSVV